MIEVPGYKVLRKLGQGGMASVYLALQQGIERPVALKVLTPAYTSDARDPERFVREARIAGQLAHPNIVTVHEVGKQGSQLFIAMEFCPGTSLEERLKRGLTVGAAMAIVHAIAGALGFAHAKGFIHRDIKPDNILFRADDTPVLSDFGIARPTAGEARMTVTGAFLGTPRYMSPEQAKGEALDGRSDLYSLGVVLFELLSGAPPFDADSFWTIGYLHIHEPVPELAAPFAPIQPLVDRCLAKDPAARFESGDALAAALDEFAERQPEFMQQRCGLPGSGAALAAARTSSKRSQAAATPARRPRTGTRWLAGLAGGAAVVALGGWLVLVRQSPLPAEPGGVATGEPGAVVTTEPEAVATPGAVDAVQPGPAASLAGPDEAEPDVESAAAPPDRGETEQDASARADNERQQRIDALLNAAAAATAAGNLLPPNANNAYEQYRAVLALDARNAAASDGLGRVVASAAAALQTDLKAGGSGALSDVRRRLGALRQLFGEHRALTGVAGRVRELETQAAAREREQRKRQTQIDAIVADLEQSLSPPGLNSVRLTAARGQLAQLAELAPGHRALSQGRVNLLASYRRLAGTLADDGNLTEALAVATAGLDWAPNDSQLRGLRTDLKARQARAREIERLSARIVAGIAPNAGDLRVLNAAASAYADLQRSEPAYPQLTGWYAELTRAYQRLAEKQMAAGGPEAARETLSHALAFAPGHAELARLREETERKKKVNVNFGGF